jgi:hypothetical protein
VSLLLAANAWVERSSNSREPRNDRGDDLLGAGGLDGNRGSASDLVALGLEAEYLD